jgi:NAD(P)-dependent dehydrogenase (short-subunit alcohol dehydrogenase family)
VEKNMSSRLQGKVAVITGGSNGMGRASVLRFLAEGCKVVFVDINDAAAEEVLALAKAAGTPDVRYVHGDVAEENDVAGAIALARKEFGTIDCVFANAAVGGARGLLTDMRVEDWDFTQAVVLRSVFLAIKHGARALKEEGKGGSLIVTASVAGMAVSARTAYGVAKAGVLHLVKSAAYELGPSLIRVNAISPGAILTPMGGPNYQSKADDLKKLQPLPVLGMPEDIASMALYLASDESHFINGANFVVDGGAVIEPGVSTAPMIRAAQNAGLVGRDFGSTGMAPIYQQQNAPS